MPAERNQKTIPDRNRESRKTSAQDSAHLDRCYGRIGIEAVAAALQFSTVREPAAEGASRDAVRIEDRFIEIAA